MYIPNVAVAKEGCYQQQRHYVNGINRVYMAATKGQQESIEHCVGTMEKKKSRCPDTTYFPPPLPLIITGQSSQSQWHGTRVTIKLER